MHILTPLTWALLGLTRLASASPITKAADLIDELERRQTASDLLSQPRYRNQVIGPSSPQWENTTARWSTFSAPTFDVAFIPATEQDLSEGLRFITSRDIPFLAQGGGHGYSPTLGSIQNAVMINLRNFNKIAFGADGAMTVGGAALFGDIYQQLYQNRRELTLGSCPCVGAVGATLGGGHGRLQGKHGLSADALTSVRLALWNGTISEVSNTKNPELFWGLRGAGQNYGVVISATFKTFPQTNNGLHYNADMVFTDDSIEGVAEAINKIIPGLDPGLALDLIFFTDPVSLNATIFLNLVYSGPTAKGVQYANLFATSPTSQTTKRITRLSNNATSLTFARLPYESAGGSIAAACAKGLRQNTYSANLKQFDLKTTAALYNDYRSFVRANPLAAGSIVLWEIFGQQAVLAAPDTAAANREFANVLALVEMAYSDDAVTGIADSWAKGWRNTLIKPAISGYSRHYVYQNYAHGDEPLQALYGYEASRLQRLGKLKSRFDPQGNFNGYHAVPPR